MLFSRVISFLAFLLAFGTFALAKPVTTVEPGGDEKSIENVFASLKAKTDVILPEIKNLAAGGNANSDSLEPLLTELVEALASAKGSLAGIGVISSDASVSTVVELLQELLNEIVDTLELLPADALTTLDFSGLLSDVDTALAAILHGLDLILDGVVALVASLVSDLTVPLGDLGMVQTLQVLEL